MIGRGAALAGSGIGCSTWVVMIVSLAGADWTVLGAVSTFFSAAIIFKNELR